jgi:tetratricopeptide (TPR) repeat protein
MNKILFLAIIAIGISAPVHAQAPADSSYQFAQWLYQQRDYFRAVTFYKQAVFSHPQDSALAADCYYRMGLSCLRARQQNLAMQYFYQVVANYAGAPAAVASKFGMGLSKFQAQAYGEALIDFAAFTREYPQHRLAAPARFHLSLCRMGLGQWDSCRQEMDAVRRDFPQSPLAALADSLRPTLGQGLVLPHKSPVLSLCLSTVFPGAGQFYSDRGKDGLYILVYEALLGLAAYFSYTNRETINIGYTYAWGGLFGLFHLTNMYGAVNAAQNANKIIDYNQQELVRQKINQYAGKQDLGLE